MSKQDNTRPKVIKNLDGLFDLIDIHKHNKISFHHHFRNGDLVINKVLDIYKRESVKNIHLFPSAIFPSYEGILDLIKNNQVQNITTNYVNGPVADYISSYGLPGKLTMQTHGGRARAIEEGLSKIDLAFIAVPYANYKGDATGSKGVNACGSLGYIIPDVQYAKTKVLLTDTLVDEEIIDKEIDGSLIDYIIVLDQIGNKNGIVSGTTNITTNPVGVKIARNTSKLLDELGLIKEGFSFQSGAGGVSLRVTKDVKDIMLEKQIKASFFSGGITKYHVEMLEENLVEKLYDVQCFDLEAISSLQRNPNHIAISSSLYANPSNPNRVIKDLDVVILGATEIDENFNVNVTTDSHGNIIGGSGGHSDTASEAFVSVIVSPLIKGRIPIVKDRVTTITTKGEHVDVFVTERGIAINPKRKDLINKLKDSTLNLLTITELKEIAHKMTGIPRKLENHGKIIGEVEDRTLTIIDNIYLK